MQIKLVSFVYKNLVLVCYCALFVVPLVEHIDKILQPLSLQSVGTIKGLLKLLKIVHYYNAD